MLQDCSTAPRPLVVNLCIRPYRCGGASNSVRYEVFDGFIFGRSSRDLQRSLVDAILTSEKRRSAICADSGGFVKMASRRDVWPGHYADRPMVEAWCCADFGGGDLGGDSCQGATLDCMCSSPSDGNRSCDAKFKSELLASKRQGSPISAAIWA